jgi:ComF family protein
MHLQQLEGVRAAVEMSGAARHLVHLLKYRYFEPAAGPMARAMRPLAESLAVDYAFAVPLHRSRLRERGFNQSELLMKGLGLPKGPGTLLRRRKTERQVGSGFRERLKHVAGAFAYEGPRLDGQTVAIVDDVITTGATMAECAAALTDAGARKVWGVAFARASYRLGSDEPIED